MNIIRTQSVELSSIPAIAYKQKLASGGAGIRILRLDAEVSGSAGIDKRTGEAVPYRQNDAALFPIEAFDEAIELTQGLPFSSRGKIVVAPVETAEADEVAETVEEKTKVSMVDSDEYRTIIARYSDEKGKLNYALMNKDFIQFAAKSKVVSDMAAEKKPNDAIVLFVIKSRAALIAGKKESLDDGLAAALIETLDEIDPRSAFKELKLYVNRQLARS